MAQIICERGITWRTVIAVADAIVGILAPGQIGSKFTNPLIVTEFRADALLGYHGDARI